ncbi:PHD finger protein rhinoceros isoform X3 [Palaemon carinicauda]|uniref:PHD finger protein rhinoceros isoform X3 n=1 Tax=Palaemon carinicauda TaxID=392227 RepID=UPI0035B674E8
MELMKLLTNPGKSCFDREPGKRKVKPSKAALIDLAELDLGESSDDSDFNVDEAKLNDDDDISINSDPDALDDNDDDDDGEDDDEVDEEEESEGEAALPPVNDKNLSVSQLLERARKTQALEMEKGIERPRILVCSVCLGDHSDDLNEIVTCDGCSVSVHEGCYGISDSVSVSSTVSSSSTEPWFCDACKASVGQPPCELCPNLGYTIFKETEMGRWVHLVCALYIPGVAFSEVDKLSFPTLFEMPYNKWGSKTCSLCEDERFSKTGVCIGCDAGMCREYFHVTCAQREGLLSEVNHGEADQADPYYAHCKLHTDRELIRRRKRNWLALQLHMKQNEADKSGSSQEIQDRIQRKLGRYRDKYLFNKNNRPTPWYPTQKMPRALSTSASLFRSLLRKTELMGLSTESQAMQSAEVGDIRKKWHIPPAFNVEFISYYLDRTNRLSEMKDRLDQLLTENRQLTEEEVELRAKFNVMEKECDHMKSENDMLLNKALELHDLLKGLAGRPLPLPPVVAALHNPPSPPLPTRPLPKGSLRTPIMTKAAAKMMMTEQVPPVGVYFSDSVPTGLSLNRCRVCQQMKEQHLLIECDTCGHYYHLSCLDPPLTRMPKKTKQMGWQCSDCCKSDSDKASEVDTAAPRRLRRNIKEPAKFSPSVGYDSKNDLEKNHHLNHTGGGSTANEHSNDNNGPVHLYHPGVASLTSDPLVAANSAPVGTKRKLSTDSKRGGIKKRRKSQGEFDTYAGEMALGETPSDACAPQTKESHSTDQAKKGQMESQFPDDLQVLPLNSVVSQGKDMLGMMASAKLPANASLPSAQPVSCSASSMSTITVTAEVNSTSQAQMEGSAPVDVNSTSSPSRSRRQPCDSTVNPSPVKLSSPTRGRRSQIDSGADSNTPEAHSQVPVSSNGDIAVTADVAGLPSSTSVSLSTSTTMTVPTSTSVSIPTSTTETTDSYPRRRGAPNVHLETNLESLPSASLNSPTSESFHSAEDDPNSPRKEKRHRDGSKKKKKDKDKDKEQKKKKHHHRDKHGLGEMASEMVTPVRIKIKPLPPRPLDDVPVSLPLSSPLSANSTTTIGSHTSTANATTVVTSSVTSTPSTMHSSYQTVTPPAGYPPLPPGYTLTQPMAPPATTTVPTSIASHTAHLQSVSQPTTASMSHTNTTSTLNSQRSPSTNTQRSPGAANRRKSDPSDPQQFSKCDVCGETGGVTNTVSCDECNKAYHFNCLEPPLKKSPKRRGYSWFCEDCDNACVAVSSSSQSTLLTNTVARS